MIQVFITPLKQPNGLEIMIKDQNGYLIDINQEKVDHSVLCYGWGEEDGEKFWYLQNSWGVRWGENGRFRMRRGTDESAIESMGESAIPIVLQKYT